MEKNREFLDSLDTKNRFSEKVENYVKFRPHYPKTLIEFMEQENLIRKEYITTDIGAGTGKFIELLLQAGFSVIAVDPNKPMLDACRQIYGHYEQLTCIDGSSEATNLPDRSVHLITTAQAFHWFKIEETKKEWERILKPQGYVALIWNSRLKGEKASSFQRDYEEFVTYYGKNYSKMQENFLVQEKINILFEKNGYQEFHTPYTQNFDFESLKGRALSSSYMPQPDDESYPDLVISLKELFDKHQVENQVTIDYDTELIYGKLD
jgi:ubiquinone/menaquinone biosynthesis C-methylase UbiE